MTMRREVYEMSGENVLSSGTVMCCLSCGGTAVPALSGSKIRDKFVRLVDSVYLFGYPKMYDQRIS